MVCFHIAMALSWRIALSRAPLERSVKSITLFYSVASLSFEMNRNPPPFWVALADPPCRSPLAFGFWGLSIVAGPRPESRGFGSIYLALMNQSLLFNLIPAFPLDGGRAAISPLAPQWQ
jgi:Zn-dependent protease